MLPVSLFVESWKRFNETIRQNSALLMDDRDCLRPSISSFNDCDYLSYFGRIGLFVEALNFQEAAQGHLELLVVLVMVIVLPVSKLYKIQT
jgi:hypothetical protein